MSPLRIGSIEINSRLALAPMAGVTDSAFRQICSEMGAGLTYTELVSSKALCYQDKKSRELLRLTGKYLDLFRQKAEQYINEAKQG